MPHLLSGHTGDWDLRQLRLKITSAVLRMSRVKDPRQFGSECSHSHAALGASGLAGLSEIEMHRPLLWRHHGCLCRLARCSSMSVMADEPPKVSIRLWRANVIVLFDWLTSTDLNAVPITHPAQKEGAG